MTHPRLEGLTDLGTTSDTVSNKRLQKLLGGDGVEATQAKIEATKGMDTPGMLDVLKSPQGLLGLLAAGGMAATEGGGEAGAQTLLGTLLGADQKVQEYQASKNKQIEDLQTQLEKSQQRLATMIQQSPEAFTDDEGNLTATPEQFGRMLGFGIDVNPVAKVRRAKQSEKQTALLESLDPLLDKAIEDDDTDSILRIMQQKNSILGNEMEDQDLMDLISTDPTKLVDKMMTHYTPGSIAAAIEQTELTGKPMHHSSIFSLLVPKDTAENRVPVSEKIYQEGQEALRIHAAFLADPNNEAWLSKPWGDQMTAALGAAGKPNLFDSYRKTYNIRDPKYLPDQMIGPILMQASKFVTTIEAAKAIPLSDEERRDVYNNVVDELIRAVQHGQQLETGTEVGSAVNSLNIIVERYYPELTAAQRDNFVAVEMRGLLEGIEGMTVEEFRNGVASRITELKKAKAKE